MRLPPPQFCPFPIVDLLKKCFIEDPHQRPSFLLIRDTIAQIRIDLRNEMSRLKDDHQTCSKGTVIYSDVPMKKQYLAVKEYNQNSSNTNHFTKEENQPEIFNTSALCDMDKNYMGSYASLDSPIPTHSQENTPVNWNDDFGCIQLTPESSLKRNMLSKRNENYRSYLTYSGERLLDGRIGLHKPSQSCNPLYMFQSLVKSKKESETFVELNIKD